MNFKTTGVLVVLVLVVGLVCWFYLPRTSRPVEKAPPSPPQEQKPVFDPQPREDQLVRVELERAGKPRLVFVKDSPAEGRTGSADWRMTEPQTLLADSAKVLSLARTVTGLQARSRLEPGTPGAVRPAEAGLEPPAAVVTVVDQDGRRYAVEIGGSPAMSNDTYVRVVGEAAIQVVTRDLRPHVEKTGKDFRAQRLVRITPDQATRIEITHEGRSYDFSKNAAGDWVINAPVRAAADRNKIREKLLNPLNTLTAVEFVEDGAAVQSGLDQPFLTITVTTEQKPAPPPSTEPATETQPESAPIVTTHVLTIGDLADLKGERRYAQAGPGAGVVIVNQANVANLVPKLDELRDPKITRLTGAAVTEIELNVGGQTATLKKVGGVWQGSGDLAAADQEAVGDLLAALEGLSALGYVDQPETLAAYGLDPPRAELKITAQGRLEPLVLRIGAPTASGRNAHVQRGGEPGVIVVAAAAADRLAVSPLALRAREVFALSPEQLTRIAVERPEARYELVRADGAWQLTTPGGAPADPGATRTLGNDLARLRARQVVGKGNPGAFGLDRPDITVRFEVTPAPEATQPAENEAGPPPPPPQSHVLRVALKENETYAQRDDDPYIFELDPTVRKVLTAELIDPRLFAFKPEDVSYVKVVATGGTLEFAKEGTQWKYVPDPYVQLAQTKVQEFVKDLAGMRAEQWVAWSGGDLAAAGLDDAAPASLTVRTSDGREFLVRMTQERPGQLPRRAALAADQRIFVMRQADIDKLMRGLDEYVKTGETETPAAASGASPGVPSGTSPPRTPPPGG